MRHNKKFNHLSRKKAHRDALLSNLASSLILHKRITTTLAKAKALRVYVEPLITRSRKDDTTNRRVVFAYLQNKESVKELFSTVAAKVGDRPGGYTRILKTGEAKKAKTTRRRRSKKAAPAAEAAKAEAPAETPAEAPAEEAPKAE